MEMSRDLASFERELAGSGDYRDAFKVALNGLVNNTFTRSLREIDETNLPTLEISHAATYMTIKDRRIREGLVVSGLFELALHKSPRASKDLEIGWHPQRDIQRLLFAVEELTAGRNAAIPPPGGWSGQAYEGGEATMVFMRALGAVVTEIKGCDWARFDVLHKIAHGRERKSGSPLDEIRISVLGKVPPLTEALRRMRG